MLFGTVLAPQQLFIDSAYSCVCCGHFEIILPLKISADFVGSCISYGVQTSRKIEKNFTVQPYVLLASNLDHIFSVARGTNGRKIEDVISGC